MSDDTISSDLSKAVRAAAKGWKRQKRHADRNDRVSYSFLRWMRSGSTRASIRDTAFEVMEQAYNHASANGKYYANARQIMYAARPLMLAKQPSLPLDGNFSVYFTQALLKDYIEEYSPNWRVVWDARGHLVEPYTDKTVGLGGIEVVQYIGEWTENFGETPDPDIGERVDTVGPVNRFGSALFIEKEGFAEILKDAGIGRKFDIAAMSTKGLPVKAACDLIGALEEHAVMVYVLHDFDLAGFKIVKTLTEGTRMAIGTDVVDLGLRLEDVEGLQSEPVEYKQGKDPKEYLEECGATPQEQEFLVEGGHRGGGWIGKRIEINAMTSDQLVTWIEEKLESHGVKKVLPDKHTLEKAYRRAVKVARLYEIMDEEKREDDEDSEGDKKIKIPARLAKRVAKAIKGKTIAWDDAVWNIATKNGDK